MDLMIVVVLAIFGTTAVISGACAKGPRLNKIVMGVVWGLCALVVAAGILFAGCLVMITAI